MLGVREVVRGPAIHIEDEIEGQDDVATGGFLVFTRYKRRGRTSGAVFCGDFYPHLPVTLDLVNRVIAAWEEVYARARSTPHLVEGGARSGDR